MVASLDLDQVVHGLENGLGKIYLATRPAANSGGHVPVFHQILDAEHYSVAFEPGSETYQVLANDQNRFASPRSLPPILDLELPEEADNPTGAYVVTRYAYSDGAYQLLEDLLSAGQVFSMNGFLQFAWSLAQAIAYLHGHKIVHGQWNARSVVAIPTETLAHPVLEMPSHRYEVVNTGVCFRDGTAVPREYLERGYYPPEVFLSEKDVPDYGALDLVGDVFCFAAFLKDLMQRACSSEELPSQAKRILEELQKEANRRGWKASPESLRRKEMEILDHLYTIRVCSETLIQEGLRTRDERCSAAHLLACIEDLHEKATSYLRKLFEHAFEAVNVFGEDLQHYTTFQLEVSPRRINSFQDSHVVLEGKGLPHELVRVTLNERHQGVTVLSAQPGRVEFKVDHGFRSGRYRVSVNNRRTNGELEVYSPQWQALLPAEVHQPWEGFGNIRLDVRGQHLPCDIEYGLRVVRDGAAGDDDTIPAVVVLPAGGDPAAAATALDASASDDVLQLTFPCDTAAGEYELFANALPTGLRTTVLEQLPDPAIRGGGLLPDEIKNHRDWSLRLTGRDFDPRMVVDFGADTPDGVRLSVISATEAELHLPSRFPPGAYRMRVNYRETDVELSVIEPRWTDLQPTGIKLLRAQGEPTAIELHGQSLPLADERLDYTLAIHDEEVRGAVAATEELEPERRHRILIAPNMPRGRCTVRFGDLDTGLELQVRRQLPRAAWAGMIALLFVLLGGTGVLLHGIFLPRIADVTPVTLFTFGAPTLHVRGAHLAAVELLAADGSVAGSFPVTATEEPGHYRFTPTGLVHGEYRLRAVGPLYGAAPSEQRVTLRDPGFRSEPGIVHRLQDAELRIVANEGFDLSSISSLQLYGADGAMAADLPVTGGLAMISKGRFHGADEGRYEIALDGTRPVDQKGTPSLEVDIVGPRIESIAPNPATPDAEGMVALTVAGSHLPPRLPLMLIGADGDADSIRHLESVTAEEYRAVVPMGDYRLVLAPEGVDPEPIDGVLLSVLPPPSIAEVSPRKLDPGQKATVTVTGTNLRALERIVLEAVDGNQQPLEVPIDADRVLPADALQASFDFEVELPPGSYRVAPSDAVLTIDVFDDCRDALQRFEDSGEIDQLLECLGQGRPPADVRRRIADLFFDRGLFDQAREQYASDTDLVARFRVAFVDAFLHGRGVALEPPSAESRQTPYGVAALRLRGGDRIGFPAEVALPWELEYVRGLTAADPETAVQAFQSAIDKKTQASGSLEVAGFEPARRALVHAHLDLAVDLIARSQIPRARALLEAGLVEDRDAWRRLGVDDRALALFWSGHTRLWYDGDAAAAADLFARAAEGDRGPAAAWARHYLIGLGKEAPGDDLDPRAAAPAWEDAFTRLFRLFKEATESPNYNLLAAGKDTSSYLTPAEQEKIAALRQLLGVLEQVPVSDPFAHHALLHLLHNAQQVSWPAQAGAGLAEGHRARLQGLAIPAELEAVREYYLVRGDLEHYDYSQISSFTRGQRSDLAKRIEALLALPLPEPLRELAERLKNRFLNPSVVWWRQSRK